MRADFCQRKDERFSGSLTRSSQSSPVAIAVAVGTADGCFDAAQTMLSVVDSAHGRTPTLTQTETDVRAPISFARPGPGRCERYRFSSRTGTIDARSTLLGPTLTARISALSRIMYTAALRSIAKANPARATSDTRPWVCASIHASASRALASESE